jgi:GT2 family glycosyltransferase
MTIKTSIILVNYNTFQLTKECIESIYSYVEDISFEIILIDNASAECPAEDFTALFPNIKLIVNSNNVGFGIANNQGMEIAKGEFLLLLNSDTLIHKNCIQQSVNYLDKNIETYQILGCQQYNGKGEIIDSTFLHSRNILLAQVYANPIIKHFLKLKKVLPTKTQKVVGVSGSFMLMHRKVFESTKGFDPDFFLYNEETDWFKNRIKNQYQTVFYPETSITHFVKGSAESKNKSQQEVASQALYWYKKGYLTYIIFLLTTPFNLLLITILIPFRRKENRSDEWRLVRLYFSSFRCLLFTIPRFSNKFGSRKGPLKIS